MSELRQLKSAEIVIRIIDIDCGTQSLLSEVGQHLLGK